MLERTNVAHNACAIVEQYLDADEVLLVMSIVLLESLGFGFEVVVLGRGGVTARGVGCSFGLCWVIHVVCVCVLHNGQL